MTDKYHNNSIHDKTDYLFTVGGKGAYRFCGTTTNNISVLSIGNVRGDPECQERVSSVRDKLLSLVNSVVAQKDEKECLPCLFGCGTQEKSTHSRLKQDAENTCMIFYTEGLSYISAIQLECDHIFHY